jgi:hypothetical protein
MDRFSLTERAFQEHPEPGLLMGIVPQQIPFHMGEASNDLVLHRRLRMNRGCQKKHEEQGHCEGEKVSESLFHFFILREHGRAPFMWMHPKKHFDGLDASTPQRVYVSCPRQVTGKGGGLEFIGERLV